MSDLNQPSCVTNEDREWFHALVSVTGSSYSGIDCSYANHSVEQVIDDLIQHGMASLDSLRQRMRLEVLESVGGDLRDLSDVSFPEEPVLQKDFLAISDRKEKLASLRSSGDAQATAEYEHECLNAIFSATSFGYESLTGKIPSDNRSIHELLESNARGCGGLFIQASHWIEELGITAFGVRCNESIFGGEGHRTFIVRDALGKYFLFDPALGISLVPIPEDFFEQSLQLDEKNTIALDAKNEGCAYKERIHPHMIVRSVRSQIRSILLQVVLKDISTVSQKRLLERWKEFDGEEISHVARQIEISILIKEGKIEEARQLALKLFEVNKNSPVMLHYLAEAFLKCGDVENFNKVFQNLGSKLYQILQNIDDAIAYRLRTDCMEGKRITPIMLRREKQLEIFMELLNLLALNAFNIQESKLGQKDKKEKLEILDLMGSAIFKFSLLVLTLYRKFLFSRGVKKEEEQWERICGKTTALYIRLRQITIS